MEPKYNNSESMLSNLATTNKKELIGLCSSEEVKQIQDFQMNHDKMKFSVKTKENSIAIVNTNLRYDSEVLLIVE